MQTRTGGDGANPIADVTCIVCHDQLQMPQRLRSSGWCWLQRKFSDIARLEDIDMNVTIDVTGLETLTESNPRPKFLHLAPCRAFAPTTRACTAA